MYTRSVRIQGISHEKEGSFIKNKTYPYVYKFWYNTGRGAWYILEQKNAPESGDIYEDDTHYWSIVEEKSIAQDVLKVVLAYAG